MSQPNGKIASLVPEPEPLTLRFNVAPALAPAQIRAPLIPVPFLADTTPQIPQASRPGMRVAGAQAARGTGKPVAISPLDFPRG